MPPPFPPPSPPRAATTMNASRVRGRKGRREGRGVWGGWEAAPTADVRTHTRRQTPPAEFAAALRTLAAYAPHPLQGRWRWKNSTRRRPRLNGRCRRPRQQGEQVRVGARPPGRSHRRQAAVVTRPRGRAWCAACRNSKRSPRHTASASAYAPPAAATPEPEEAPSLTRPMAWPDPMFDAGRPRSSSLADLGNRAAASRSHHHFSCNE